MFGNITPDGRGKAQRLKVMAALTGAAMFASVHGFAQASLTITGTQTIPAGTYSNITVTSGGRAIIDPVPNGSSNDINVTGTFRVQAGGYLQISSLNSFISGNAFVADANSKVVLLNSTVNVGTNAGALRTTTKTQDPNSRFVMRTSIDQNIGTWAYDSVSILGPAIATITGQVMVDNFFLLKTPTTGAVMGAGIRITDDANYLYGPGTFHADSISLISFSSTAGIDGTTAGAIRMAVKDFDEDCDFTYTGSVTSPQGTLGNSFPDRVRSITIQRPNGATLTHNTAVREQINMLNGNLLTNGFTLTLISATPAIPGLTAASTTVANVGGASSRIIGPVTVQRYINPRFNPGAGYRHYSSSVTGSTVADFQTSGFTPVVNPTFNTVPYMDRYVAGMVTPFPNVFYYDQAQVTTQTSDPVADFDHGWQSPSTSGDALQVTKGYTVYISPASTVDFVGELNQNDQYVTPTLTANTRRDGGWQFIGNPYPSKIDWNQVQRTTPAVLDQISQYRSTGGTQGYYATYINGTGANGGSPIIAQNQGFFVRVQQGQSGTVTFTSQSRLLNFQQDPTAPFYRGANTNTNNRPQVRLQLAGGNNLSQEMVTYFQQGATYGYDQAFDAVHIFAGYPVNFFTTAANENLDINGLPEISTVNDYTMPLTSMVSQAGTFTISATEMVNFPAGYQVILQDAVTGTTQDLALNPTYTFTTAANAATNRFSVRFRAAAVTGLTQEVASNQLSVYPNPVKSGATLNLSLPGAEKGAAVTATLYNQVGQRVWSQQFQTALGGVRADIPTAGLSRGVYTLKVAAQGLPTSARRVVVE